MSWESFGAIAAFVIGVADFFDGYDKEKSLGRNLFRLITAVSLIVCGSIFLLRGGIHP